MKQIALKYRIALTVFALTGIMLALLLWQVQRLQDNAITAAQASDEAVIMDVLGELSRFALINSEYSDLEHYFTMVRKNPHVMKVIVADAADRIVMSTDMGLLGLALPVLRDSESTYWRSRKLANAAGSQGLIAVEFSNAELLAARKRTRTWAIVVALASMTSITLVSVIMGAALTRRLAVLSRASKRIGEGDLKTRIDLPGSDEVSELGRTVDAMARKIEAALEDLRESEEKYKQLVETTETGYVILDGQGRVVDANLEYVRLTDHSRLEEILARTVVEWTAAYDLDRNAEEVRKCGEQGFVRNLEIDYVGRDGRITPVEINATIQRTPGSVKILTLCRDITERRRTEEKIRNLNRVYAVLSNINQAIIRIREPRQLFQEACRIAAEDGGFRMAWIGLVDGQSGVVTPTAIAGHNDGYVEKLMITLNSESRGRGPTGSAVREGRRSLCNDIEHDERMAPWREDALRRGYRSSAAFPLVLSGAVRGSFNLYASAPDFFNESEVKLLDELALDISYAMEFAEQEGVRRQAEESLQLSEARLERILESIKDGFFVLDKEWRYSYVNTAAAASSSSTTDALLGKRIWDLDPGLIGGPFHEACQRARAGEIVVQKDVFYEAFKKWYDLTIYPFEDGVSVYFRDITAQKHAEEEQQKLISLVETSTDMIGIATLDGEVTYLNNACKKLVGIDSLEEIRRTQIFDYIVSEDLKRFHEEVVPTIQKTGTWTGEIRFRHWKTGEAVTVELTGFMIFDRESGRPLAMASISRDIRERKDLEARLLHAQKMEAVGQLAGGIAHDFNNILTAIIGYGNLVSMKLPANDPARAPINEILSAADRAAGLTRSLLAFSRKQIIHPQPVSVNSIVNRVQGLLRHVIVEDIELRTVLTDQDPTIFADSSQIEQLLLNLATNARDAMPKGGQLTISTALSRIDDEYIRHHRYGKTGEYVSISVTDTGEGMDELTRQRVFEPFFTTKEVGKGTGLGLAMVYGSVKQHNGYINVYSEPGRGTTFNVYLPVLHVAAKPLALGESQAMPQRGNETVLLAEDDPSVRSMTRSVLEEFGYRVIEAVDGGKALEQVSRYRDEIDILVVDVVMPKKNGKEVFEEAKRLKPGIKVLFTSGYPAHIIREKGELEEGLSFIAKPAAPHDLLNKLREVLDQ